MAVEAGLVIVVLVLFGNRERIWTDVFLAMLVITAYETFTTMWFGASPAKRLIGLHVAELDGVDRPTFDASIKRSALSAVLIVLPPFAMLLGLGLMSNRGHVGQGWLILMIGAGGWGMWLASVLSDPLGRGFADRLASTMVVPEQFHAAVTTRDLPGYADAVRPPRLSRWGRIADLDVRGRARMRRLNDAPVLAAAIGLLALAASFEVTPRVIILGSSAAWIVLFVAHETWLVHRTGVTPGHALAGLVIVARSTGTHPSIIRSFLRATVLGLTLYVPLLWPLLGASMAMMRWGANGRSLHDLAGGTVVVLDPTLDPETQRQRSMRMRLGRAG